MPYQPTVGELQGAILHVIYEYANLVHAGLHLHTAEGTPIDSHVQDAFLLGCRKLSDFFKQSKTGKPEMRAFHFCLKKGAPIIRLPVWKTWKAAINNQLTHITYRRVTDPQTWYGHDGTNAALLQEFQVTFRQFLDRIDDTHRSEFDQQLQKHSQRLRIPLP